MPEMHLKQTGFNFRGCGPFTKTKEIIQKFKETGHIEYIYKNRLDKACFQHDMAYGDIRDLARRTASDKILRDKGLILLKTQKMIYIKDVLLLWSISFWKKNTGSGFKNEIKRNEKLGEELHKPIIKKPKKEEFILQLKTIFSVLI